MNAKYYNLIFYDKEILQNFIFELSRNKGKNASNFKYAYIYHDKDIIEETQQPKKPHYHLWLSFAESVKSSVLVSCLNIVGIDNDSPIDHHKTDVNFLAYLTHNTSDSKKLKKQYDYKDIITNIESETFNEMYFEAVGYWKKKEKPTRAEKNFLAYTMINDIIITEQICDTYELFEFLRENEEIELLDFAIQNATKLFYLYNDTLFKRNRLRKANKGLKSKNQQALKDLQEEYERLQKQEETLYLAREKLSDYETNITSKGIKEND